MKKHYEIFVKMMNEEKVKKLWESLHREGLNSFIKLVVDECSYNGKNNIHTIFSRKGDRTTMFSYKLNNIFDEFVYAIKYDLFETGNVFEKYGISDWIFENGSGYDTKLIFKDGFELLIEHKSTSNKTNIAGHWYHKKVGVYIIIYYHINEDGVVGDFTSFITNLEECRTVWEGCYNENGPVVGWANLKFVVEDMEKLNLICGNLSSKKVFIHFV